MTQNLSITLNETQNTNPVIDLQNEAKITNQYIDLQAQSPNRPIALIAQEPSNAGWKAARVWVLYNVKNACLTGVFTSVVNAG